MSLCAAPGWYAVFAVIPGETQARPLVAWKDVAIEAEPDEAVGLVTYETTTLGRRVTRADGIEGFLGYCNPAAEGIDPMNDAQFDAYLGDRWGDAAEKWAEETCSKPTTEAKHKEIDGLTFGEQAAECPPDFAQAMSTAMSLKLQRQTIAFFKTTGDEWAMQVAEVLEEFLDDTDPPVTLYESYDGVLWIEQDGCVREIRPMYPFGSFKDDAAALAESRQGNWMEDDLEKVPGLEAGECREVARWQRDDTVEILVKRPGPAARRYLGVE